MNLKAEIVNFFESNPGKFFKRKLIYKKLDISGSGEKEACEILGKLVKLNYLVRKRDNFAKNLKNIFIIGKVAAIKGGSAFLTDKSGKREDTFVPFSKISSAYDGDIVLCSVTKNGEAKVLEVIERSKKKIAGIVSNHYLFPFSGGEPIPVSTEENNKVAVVMELSEKGNESRIEILGNPLDVQTVLKAVELQFDLQKEFDRDVLKEASLLKMDSDYSQRKDLRNITAITIDPKNAKDFDDAISVERKLNGKLSVFVHIADVSHFVKEGSKLDLEAKRRGNSVYLPTTVYPMFPKKLSNDLCSLNEKEDKLCMTVEVTLDEKGKIWKVDFYESVINSAKRLCYEEAEEIIKGKNLFENEIVRIVRDGYEIAKILNEKRYQRGALDFDLEKPHLKLKDERLVESVFPEIRLESHKLIEELMLLANEAVAAFLSKNKVPFIYRVHEEPETEKLEKLSPFLNVFNILLPRRKGNISSKDLQTAIERAKGKPFERLVSYHILRAMMRAKYSEIEDSHFGLALKKYCHFTSPIRRYADLTVHRALKRCLTGVKNHTMNLKAIAENCSETERMADEAEREALSWLILNYLKDRVGDDFKVIITGFTKFGIRVELMDELVEGIIPFNTMEQDHFVVDPKGFFAKGKYTSKTYRLGQIMEAKLIKLDIFNKEPHFAVI